MSFFPINQVRLTNVVIVKLKKGGKRFEIACYPNKVLQWREKIETDLDEVLQAKTIFTNVSKGVLAKKDELKAAFGITDEAKILLEILMKGELQVSEKEREVLQDKTYRDIATIVAEKCVDPQTNRPLTVGLVERAMKDIHYSVNSTKNTKQQALDVIKLLQSSGKIPIERAKMRLKLTMNKADSEKLASHWKDLIAVIEKQETVEDKFVMIGQIQPENFRKIDDLLKKESKGGALEVVNVSVTAEGDGKLE